MTDELNIVVLLECLIARDVIVMHVRVDLLPTGLFQGLCVSRNGERSATC